MSTRVEIPMRDDFQQMLEPTTESTRVRLHTHSYTLEGNIYLPRSMKESRRVTNLLNTDRRFIALTDVQVIRQNSSDSETPKKYSYIHVNLSTVEWIQPVEEMSPPPPDSGTDR